jgi:hypothetical protein
MPLDDHLPLPHLPARLESAEIARHFESAFQIMVDPAGINVLPAADRLSLAGARLPEPPEAVLLDRVLQLVPTNLLTPVKAVLILTSRGTGRQGGARGGVVRVSAHEARLREGDPRYDRAVSLFTTTTLHEIGHVVFEACLSDTQQEHATDTYLSYLASQPQVPGGEPTQVGLEHFFIDLFIAALVGRGEPPLTAGVARRTLSMLGVPWRR